MTNLYEDKAVVLAHGKGSLDVLATRAGLEDASMLDIERINLAFDSAILFFDNTCRPMEETTIEDATAAKAIHFIVPSGYDQPDGSEIYGSFTFKRDIWVGPYWGNICTLLSNYEDYCRNPVKRDSLFNNSFRLVGRGYLEVAIYNGKSPAASAQAPEVKVTSNLVENVYNQLMDKEVYGESWAFNLKSHLCLTIKKIYTDAKHIGGLRGPGYLYSKDKLCCILNPGLIDVYGNYIYILDTVAQHSSSDVLDKEVVGSSTRLIHNGFAVEDLQELPEPVLLCEDANRLLFNCRQNSTVLIDINAITHIDKERRERLPEKYRDLSTKALLTAIKASIDEALTIGKTDYRYILPCISYSSNRIGYLFPLKLGDDDETTNALVVCETQGVYQLKTVLTLEQATRDVLGLCNPRSTWLWNKK